MLTDTPTTPSSGEQRITVGGIEICYETFGDAGHPALLLVMGLGAQMTAWETGFCQRLAGEGFRVVRFDNRDIGRSTHLTHLGVPNTLAMIGMMAFRLALSAPYRLKDMAADAVGLLDALGIERAHVVGASMGGMIGQEMAINFGPRLRSLTSIMSTTGDRRLPSATAEAQAVLFKAPPRDRDGYIAHQMNILRVIRGPHFPEEAAFDRDRAERTFDRGINPKGTTRQLAAILASGNRTAALRKVDLPTLVIHGDADPLVNVQGGHMTAAAIRGSRLEIIERMGHSLPRSLWPILVGLIAAHARQH